MTTNFPTNLISTSEHFGWRKYVKKRRAVATQAVLERNFKYGCCSALFVRRYARITTRSPPFVDHVFAFTFFTRTSCTRLPPCH